MNNCEQNAIVIVRNNDTDFNGGNFLTINLETEILDLSDFKAVLNMSGVIKEFDDLSSGSIEVNLSAQETKNLPQSFNGVLNIIDNENKIATITSFIPFEVISTVDNNAIATEPYTLNFDVKQGGETILTINVESAVTVEVGTTTTLPAGSDATVTNSGTLNHLVLDFGIPQGAKGDTGASGKDGQDGEDGTNGISPTAEVTPTLTGATITITDVNGTTTANITNGQDGKDGVNGTDGQDGTNATITGATASVSNTVGIPNVVVTAGGTESARSFNFAFTNLKGDKGDTGSDAEVTHENVLSAIGYTPEQSMTIQTLSATDSITLEDNTIYNGGEQTALTIALPSTVDVSFLCEIDFTSGTTATTLTYSNTIKWVGDDVNDNIFLPVASKRYTIICAYDGVNYRFTVRGVE